MLYILELKSNISLASQKGLAEWNAYDMDFPSPTRYQHSRRFYRYCISNPYTFPCDTFPVSEIQPFAGGMCGDRWQSWMQPAVGSHLSCCCWCSTSEPVLQRGFAKQGKGTHSTSCLVSWRKQTPREIQLPETCSLLSRVDKVFNRSIHESRTEMQDAAARLGEIMKGQE